MRHPFYMALIRETKFQEMQPALVETVQGRLYFVRRLCFSSIWPFIFSDARTKKNA